MPTTSIRYTVRKAIVDLLTEATTDLADGQLQVSIAWPGKRLAQESIWLDATEGDITIPVMRGPVSESNPLTRDDRFTVPIHVQTMVKGKTLEEAEARVIELFAPVEWLFASNPCLGGIPGLIGGCVLGRANGPATGLYEEGACSFMYAVANVHARESA